MNLQCSSCGKETPMLAMRSTSPHHNGILRWYCQECYEEKRRKIEELWELHIGPFAGDN